MAVDILFIHPGNQKKIYQDLAQEFTALAPPVWTTLLAGHLRQNGYTPAIYDANLEGWEEDTAGELIRRFQPGLVVIMVYGHHPSASTQTMPAAGMIARSLKEYNRDIPVAMGGIHPSSLPERTLREEKIDFVLQGEAVYSLDGLLSYLLGREKIRDVPGVWYWKDDSPKFTSPADLVSDLDKELGDYGWDLLPDFSRYRAHNMHCFQYFEGSRKSDFSDVRSPYATMNTSLGCPYSCNYCCINAIFGKPGIRYWSLPMVMNWIDQLVSQYGVRNLRLDDELFILSPTRVERFCDLLIERGYDLNLWVYARVDTIAGSLLKKLKAAGVNWICLGIESANKKVRTDVKKNIRTDITNVVRGIQNEGINVLGNFIFGLPEDNLETMEETLELALDLNCEFVNFYSAMAYPGSALYDWASQREGYLPESWESFSQHGYLTQPLPTRHLSAREVLRFRDQAFARYFKSPRYLDLIDKKFGSKVTNHLSKMMEIKLERRLI